MIAIVYPQFYGIQGIARYLDSFLLNLPTDHPPIYLITGDEQKMPRTYPGVEIIEIPIGKSRIGLLIWAWKARRMVLKLHRNGQIQIQNLHWPPLISGLFLSKKIPIILTCHTTYLGMTGDFYSKRFFKSQWGILSSSVKKCMERWIFHLATKVIVLTEQGRQEVLQYGFRGPIIVIPNGADVKTFSPDSSTTKVFDVIFSGRIERRKGSRALGAVCRELIRINPDIRIVIVGYGDDDKYIQLEMASLSNNVALTGKVSFHDMLGYYNRSKVYASTSFYEGLPGTCLEAMAICLPIVVWNLDFYKGLVQDNINGRIVPPNDFTAMATAIQTILNDEHLFRSMSNSSRRILLQSYDWKTLAKQVTSVMCC